MRAPPDGPTALFSRKRCPTTRAPPTLLPSSALPCARRPWVDSTERPGPWGLAEAIPDPANRTRPIPHAIPSPWSARQPPKARWTRRAGVCRRGGGAWTGGRRKSCKRLDSLRMVAQDIHCNDGDSSRGVIPGPRSGTRNPALDVGGRTRHSNRQSAFASGGALDPGYGLLRSARKPFRDDAVWWRAGPGRTHDTEQSEDARRTSLNGLPSRTLAGRRRRSAFPRRRRCAKGPDRERCARSPRSPP